MSGHASPSSEPAGTSDNKKPDDPARQFSGLTGPPQGRVLTEVDYFFARGSAALVSRKSA